MHNYLQIKILVFGYYAIGSERDKKNSSLLGLKDSFDRSHIKRLKQKEALTSAFFPK